MRILIFLFFISTALNAQVSSTMSYKFPEPTESASLIRTKDHIKYLGTSNVYSSPGSDIKELGLVKLSACNEILWSKLYQLPNTKIELKQILLEQGSENILHIGHYIPQTTTQRYLYIQKTDKEGNVLFAKSYDFGNLLLNNSYTSYSTSTGVVITAKFAPLGGGSSYTTLIAINNNGDLDYAYRQEDTYTGISSAQVNEDTYLIRSSNLIYLSGENGDIYWAKTYPQLLQSSNFFSALYTTDGFVVSVRKNSTYYLVKFDLNGEFVWKTDIKTTGYWPAFYHKTNGNIVVVSLLIDNTGSTKPLFITYDKNGENISEEILEDIQVEPNGFPMIFQNNNQVDLVFPYSSTPQATFQHVIYSENIEASNCLTPISIPEVDNLIDPISNLAFVQSTNMPLSNTINHQPTVSSYTITDSVRCNPIIIPDTIYSEAGINCDMGYTYFGTNNAATYYWPHNGSTNPNETLNTEGTYEVIIESCHSITHEFIEVTDYCGCKLIVPNAFSPNQDGLNDEFGGIDNCNISYYLLEIYDRWGKRLFKSEDINTKWDGTFKNEFVKSDLYFYRIKYTPATASSIVENKFIEGNVLVIY